MNARVPGDREQKRRLGLNASVQRDQERGPRARLALVLPKVVIKSPMAPSHGVAAIREVTRGRVGVPD